MTDFQNRSLPLLFPFLSPCFSTHFSPLSISVVLSQVQVPVEACRVRQRHETQHHKSETQDLKILPQTRALKKKHSCNIFPILQTVQMFLSSSGWLLGFTSRTVLSGRFFTRPLNVWFKSIPHNDVHTFNNLIVLIKYLPL